MDAQLPSTSPRDRLPLVVTPAPVIALGLVAASIGWAVWLLRDRPTTEEVELLAGMALPSSEMAIMEAAFDRAQLTDHRTDGGRVWVPRSRQSAYMRALVDAEALPREFGGSLRRALEKNSPWQSRAAQGEMLRVATQEELSLVICSMPGIERAAVLYDTESHHSLEGSGPAKTASVNVRTQPDMELDPARVQAIRVLVSASIAGLTPERVAVTDLRSGRVYVGPLEAEADRDAMALAAADPALARKIAHEHHLATKVRQSLAFLKGATVDVTVEFASPTPLPLPPGPDESQADRSIAPEASPDAAGQKLAAANAPAEIRPRSAIIVAEAPPTAPPPAPATAADVPESILVSIAVPDSYFQAVGRAVAERAGEPVLQPVAVEAQEAERIRRHVQSLLPATNNPAQRRVVITSFPTYSPSQARREQAVRGKTRSQPSVSTASIGAGQSDDVAPGVDGIVSLVSAGRFNEVPRQVWLAATSICVGLLAGFLWWSGSRRDAYPAGRLPAASRQPPRIDWAGGGDSHDTDQLNESGGTRQSSNGLGLGRAAAVLFALCACAAQVEAAGPEPTAAMAPLPDAVLSAVAPASASPQSVSVETVSERRTERDLPALRGSVPQVLPALPLTARGSSTPIDLQADPNAAAARPGQLTDWKLLAAIAATLAVVAAATAFTKRRATFLPPDVFEVLGEGSLGGQHAVRIVRFGPKTLLVGVSSAGCQTLAELTDPQATACIAAACRGVHPPLRPPVPARTLTASSQPPVLARVGGEAA
jgi:type III secretory pathway lipoprotein EscJ/flagellar biogenesis protein FliO